MKKPPVKSIRHKAQKRVHIPSGEEAGYEAASPVVQAKDETNFPKNPIVHRGQDPELYWLNKYGEKDDDSPLAVDLRSLYRHEHIAPEALVKGLYRIVATEDRLQPDLGFSVNELFGNIISHEELDKVSDYYTHSDGWTNRLIQGDSLLVMTSLLEREGMAEQVQCIYIDPPYSVNYPSNWQIRLNSRQVVDGRDESLSGEPEIIKAYRDTWELGIHSYLTFLRDRLVVAQQLLHTSGSCFVQISDENVHLVRCLMDEVFGSENFVSLIAFRTTTGLGQKLLDKACDYLIWYAKDATACKYRSLFEEKDVDYYKQYYSKIEFQNGERLSVKEWEKKTGETLKDKNLPAGARLYTLTDLRSQSGSGAAIKIAGREYTIKSGSFKTNQAGVEHLEQANRLEVYGQSPKYIRYLSDFPYERLDNIWNEQMSEQNKKFVVQTSTKVLERCILMTTDPGDLVLDPTCGSGTTAYVAEQWGRRWITIDTSRIALNIAKTRLMTATFPFYTLYQSEEGERAVAERKGKPGDYSLVKERDKVQPLRGCDVRYGFVYKKVPHITLGSIANNEPPEEETLYDQPIEDKKRLRVAGPLTVETLQNYEPTSPEELARQREDVEELAGFEDTVFEHLKSAGIKTGDKTANAVFTRIERLSSAELHAEGFYGTNGGEKKAYLHIGPKFGTVSKQAVTEAIKACRDKRDADWLLILGFAFESGITELSRSFGNFQVSIVRMHDDLLQEGLLKRDKKAASFVTIGEPDIRLNVVAGVGDPGQPAHATSPAGITDSGYRTVEIVGLDIYDPIRDEVKSRDVHDINYWMLDDNYDGSNFVVRQVFFCGGDKDEFDDWRKGLSNLAVASTKKKAEQTLKIDIDEEAFANAYGHKSRPFAVKPRQKIAVRVISQFGEETTKVLSA
jgi:adenine-specific DNA-methyltransferase